MAARYILLPGAAPDDAHLLRIPQDYSDVDAYRHITSVIARHQESAKGSEAARLSLEELSEQGFTEVKFILGPHLE